VLDRLGVAEGVVEVRGEAEAGGGVHVGGGQGVEVLVRWVHGSGAAAGAQVVARGADLSQVRERERQGTRCFFG
jgi:hypothetical protein